MHRTSTLYRWVYVSHSRLAEDAIDRAVADILEFSVARNHQLQVTGALACSGTRFGQYLEGSREGLAELKASICRDARHEQVTSILEGPADHRLFADWSLLHAGSSRYLDRILASCTLGSPSPGSENRHSVLALFGQLAAQRLPQKK